MRKSASFLRKIAVLLVAFPIIVLGIILIPLPGPGVLVVFAGLFILSLEFDWAKKHRDRLRDDLNKIIAKARARSDAIESKHKK